MKLYIARNQDGSLALFRKKKPKLFWDEKVGQYWVGSSLWLDSNDYPEVTFENSPMEVELKLIRKMKYKVGDKVMIVSCEMNPQYVGKIGRVESVLGIDDKALIKVSCKGKMIPDYATEDCLKRIDN